MSVHAFFAFVFYSSLFLSLSHLSFCHSIVGVLEAGPIAIAFGDISAAMIYESSDDGDWKLCHRAGRQGTGFQDCMQMGYGYWGVPAHGRIQLCCATGCRPPLLLSGGLSERQHITFPMVTPFTWNAMCANLLFLVLILFINLAKWLKSYAFSWSC